jgi:kinesin family protein C1
MANFSQSTTTRPTTGGPQSRPATSMENHSEDEEDIQSGKRKGMPPYSYAILSKDPAQIKKSRGYQSTNVLKPSRPYACIRDFSISTALSELHLHEDVKSNGMQDHQAIPLRQIPPPTSLSHKPSISTSLRNMEIDNAANAVVLYQGPGEVAPKTPSHIPVLSKSEALKTPTPILRRHTKSSPQKTPFLSKYSNITGNEAWDVRGRLEDMEAMYSELKSTLSGTNLERSGLEQAVELYKTKSAYISLRLYCTD